VNKKVVWGTGKGRRQVDMKKDLAFDSVSKEVKITGIWVSAITGCGTGYNVQIVYCLEFIA
jgi:hypothetical protein